MEQHLFLQKKIKPIFYTLMLTIAILFSCEKENIFQEGNKGNETAVSGDTEVPGRIKDKLTAAGFDISQGLSKFEDAYIVEYDIQLTEKQIDELIDNSYKSNGKKKHYRTYNLVEGTPRSIRVYMDPIFGSYMQQAFDAALARYNAAGIALIFERTTSSTTADIRVLSFFQESGLLGRSAGFPSGGNPAKDIFLNTFHYNNSTNRSDAISTIAHEIGHAIGFRHTDYFDRTFSCGGEFDNNGNPRNPNEGSTQDGAVHIPGTPTEASTDSWMLACSSNTDRPFTPSDYVALNSVYPYWLQLPGEGRDISVGADGSAYLIGITSEGGGYGIYKWNGASWTKIPGGAVRVAVSPNGVPWIVSSTGNISRRQGTQWEQLPGGASDIAIGSDGSVFITGVTPEGGGYGIYKWNGGSWTKIPGGAVRVAVSPDGVPWIVSSTKNIYRRQGIQWEQLPGGASDIAIGANGGIFIIGVTPESGGYGIYEWIGNQWTKLPGAATSISGGVLGRPWIVSSSNKIYRKI